MLLQASHVCSLQLSFPQTTYVSMYWTHSWDWQLLIDTPPQIALLSRCDHVSCLTLVCLSSMVFDGRWYDEFLTSRDMMHANHLLISAFLHALWTSCVTVSTSSHLKMHDGAEIGDHGDTCSLRMIHSNSCQQQAVSKRRAYFIYVEILCRFPEVRCAQCCWAGTPPYAQQVRLLYKLNIYIARADCKIFSGLHDCSLEDSKRMLKYWICPACPIQVNNVCLLAYLFSYCKLHNLSRVVLRYCALTIS